MMKPANFKKALSDLTDLCYEIEHANTAVQLSQAPVEPYLCEPRDIPHMVDAELERYQMRQQTLSREAKAESGFYRHLSQTLRGIGATDLDGLAAACLEIADAHHKAAEGCGHQVAEALAEAERRAEARAKAASLSPLEIMSRIEALEREAGARADA